MWESAQKQGWIYLNSQATLLIGCTCKMYACRIKYERWELWASLDGLDLSLSSIVTWLYWIFCMLSHFILPANYHSWMPHCSLDRLGMFLLKQICNDCLKISSRSSRLHSWTHFALTKILFGCFYWLLEKMSRLNSCQ